MWLPFALLTALLTSCQDVFIKKAAEKVDPYVIAWAWIFFSLPFLYPLLLTQNAPPLGSLFWETVLTATAILTLASIFYVKALQRADLSVAVPMLAFTPVLLLGTSPIMVGEFPKLTGLLGIFLVVAGSYVLNLKEKHRGYLAPFRSLIRHPGSRYMLAVAVLFSISANLDKIGIKQSSPLLWVIALNTALAVTLGVIMFKKTQNIGQQIKQGWPFLILVGFFNAFALFSHMIALQLTLVAYVIAIKRTSVLFTSLFGFIFFKEKGLAERLSGVLLMVAGVLVILFA